MSAHADLRHDATDPAPLIVLVGPVSQIGYGAYLLARPPLPTMVANF
jgi:hypothetical protein